MATLNMVKSLVEGNDLIARMQEDVKGIDQGPSSAITGYNNLKELLDDPEFQNLYRYCYSTAEHILQKTIKDAACYVDNGGELKIAQPNNPEGTIPLYIGTDSYDDDGDIEQNCVNEDDDGNWIPATIWDVLANPQGSLINYCGDAYYDNEKGWGPGLATDWAYSSSLSPFTEWDGHQTDNGEYFSAQGTAAQWETYLKFSSGGNPFALNSDVFM